MSRNSLVLNYPIRFLQVPGFDDRKNDVIYCRPLHVQQCVNNLAIFFPGDVQDFTENMLSHRDNKHHKDWSLDNTAFLMQKKFPNCHIVVIKPSRMDFKTFSCFKNFVESSDLGVPNHTPDFNSLVHLDELIKNFGIQLKSIDQNTLKKLLEISKTAVTISPNGCGAIDEKDSLDISSYINQDISSSKIKLIGFSKGCVVLNQFVHEFHTKIELEKNKNELGVISRIKDMYWLDGGHSGGQNTWVTDGKILGTLAKMGINVFVHVSPYQIEDYRRPWIKKEERIFSETLAKYGCKIERQLHFEDIPPSITTHFDMYNVFKNP